MELPVHDPRPNVPRDLLELRDMAIAIQENLVRLKTLDAKNRGIAEEELEIGVRTPKPGPRFRETLLDDQLLNSYSREELHLRLHEVWGQFCLMRWLFSLPADEVVDFGNLPPGAVPRCGEVLLFKEAEIHAVLWRLRFEQLRRGEADPGGTSSHLVDSEIAQRIPAQVAGKPVEQADSSDVLCTACEYAGMLACIRWVRDRRCRWNQPGIMDLDDDPFRPLEGFGSDQEKFETPFMPP